MKKLMLLLALVLTSIAIQAQHNAGDNGKVLMIVSNPAVSQQTGWPIGVWASELTHPYWEFSEAGYAIDIASPNGGKVIFDGFSHPEDESKYTAFDFISLGFIKDASKMQLLENTMKLSDVNPDNYKAIFVCGGQGPMYTFHGNQELYKFFANYYESGRPAAAICHGTNILLDIKLSNGKKLVEGKTWTGFANAEEAYADAYVGQKIQPFWIEEEAQKIPNTNFITGKPFDSFAVIDGNLITGQQQNSGAEAARLVLEAMEEDKKRYPTYVLVHGAWADESAWGFVRDQLAVKANVEVVNLPAHGSDVSDPKSIDMQAYIDEVSNVIKNAPSKVILVGHSMAGMVVSQVAEKMPNKIDKVIYVAAYLPTNGQSLVDLANTDQQSIVGPNLDYSKDYVTAKVKEDKIVAGVCADCPDFMKAALIKYHKAEPVAPLNTKANLSKNKFGAVDKYYIHTLQDKAVGYDLQKRMVKANSNIKKTFAIDSSHLPFVVKPQEFVEILTSIN